jgi:hypothetical protein
MSVAANRASGSVYTGSSRQSTAPPAAGAAGRMVRVQFRKRGSEAVKLHEKLVYG